MSALPDVEATVNLLKAILSEPLDLVSEKRRFQAFLRDYAGRSRTEQGLNMERRHLNVLVQGMRYRRYCDDAPIDGRAWTTNCDEGFCDEVVVRGGSYNSVPRDLRSAYRLRFPPSNRRFGFGFRLVQDLNP